MKQAIAGVAPPGLEEVTVMTVWPSVASTAIGRLHGRLFAIKAGWGMFTTGPAVRLRRRADRARCSISSCELRSSSAATRSPIGAWRS